jgi:hypothetical protein
MKKVSKYFTSGLKFLDYFKQPLKLQVSKKGHKKEHEQEDEVGSTWGAMLTIIAFIALYLNG